MPIPADATLFEQKMDPAEKIDFQVDLLDRLLEEGENIDSFTLVLDSAAVALGVSILTSGSYAPVEVDNVSIRFWLEVDTDFWEDPAYQSGLSCAIIMTVNTDAVPPRRRQRTLVVEIKQL